MAEEKKNVFQEVLVLIGVMMVGLCYIKTCNHILKPDTSHMTPQEKKIVDSIWDAKEAKEFKDFTDELD